jgi:hypothetical protein
MRIRRLTIAGSSPRECGTRRSSELYGLVAQRGNFSCVPNRKTPTEYKERKKRFGSFRSGWGLLGVAGAFVVMTTSCGRTCVAVSYNDTVQLSAPNNDLLIVSSICFDDGCHTEPFREPEISIDIANSNSALVRLPRGTLRDHEFKVKVTFSNGIVATGTAAPPKRTFPSGKGCNPPARSTSATLSQP